MPVVLPTAASVIALTETTLSEAVVSVLIDDALLLAGSCIDAYEADRQTAIVKWLAAHLVANTATGRTAALVSDKLGDAQQTYGRGAPGEALAGTVYGQQALALDTNGCLIRKGRARATIEVI